MDELLIHLFYHPPRRRTRCHSKEDIHEMGQQTSEEGKNAKYWISSFCHRQIEHVIVWVCEWNECKGIYIYDVLIA